MNENKKQNKCSLDYELIERITAKRAPLTPDLFPYYAGSLDDPEGYYDERGFWVEDWGNEYIIDDYEEEIIDEEKEKYLSTLDEFYRDLEENGLENKCVIWANSKPSTIKECDENKKNIEKKTDNLEELESKKVFEKQLEEFYRDLF